MQGLLFEYRLPDVSSCLASAWMLAPCAAPARLRHTGPLHGGTGLAPIRDFMLVPIGKSSAGDLPKF
jgi:hypothetical protein